MKRKNPYPPQIGGTGNPLTPQDLKDINTPIVFGEMTPFAPNTPQANPYPVDLIQEPKEKEPVKKILPIIRF